MAQDYKVRLTCSGEEVVFEASSPVTESRNANYSGFDIVHLPTDIWAYRNTSGRKFSVTGKIVSRNVQEAKQNALYLNLIRSWILPDFGDTGATPPILKFYAYNNSNIDGINTILNSYSFTFTDDVDYIFADGIDALPVIGTIGLELSETYSAMEITDKQWKIDPGKGSGSFVYGGTEITGGGNWTPPLPMLSNTPDFSELSRRGNFRGIANHDMIQNQYYGPMIQDPMSIIRNPSMTVQPSYLISERMPQIGPVFNSPFINSNIAHTQLAQQAYQTTTRIQGAVQAEQLNQFGRNNQLRVTIPIEIY